MIPDNRSQTLVDVIRDRTQPDSVVYTDSCRSHDVLDVSAFHHQRINRRNAFVDRANHVNGIEDTWNQAKRNPRGYSGISKAHVQLVLKDCKWRFNDRPASHLLAILMGWVNPDGPR